MYKHQTSIMNCRIGLFLLAVFVVMECRADQSQRPWADYRPTTVGYNTVGTNSALYTANHQAVPESPQNPEAQLKMGERYASGQGVQRNDVEAVRWFRMAAEGGNAEAQYKLAVMLEHAWGTRRDYQEALSWYFKAAKQDHAGAQNNIGLMYEKGRGVSIDYKEAVKWYAMAAKKDGGVPNYNLGLLYERGLGVPLDKDMAMKYFKLAADAGNKDALKKLPVANITPGSGEPDFRTDEGLAILTHVQPSREQCSQPSAHRICVNPHLILKNQWACTDDTLYRRACEYFYGGQIRPINVLAPDGSYNCGAIFHLHTLICSDRQSHPYCDTLGDLYALCMDNKFDPYMIVAD